MTYLQALARIADCAQQLIDLDGNLSERNHRELCRQIETARRVIGLNAMANREI